MENHDQRSQDLIDLGEASVETRGLNAGNNDTFGGQNLGLSDRDD